MATKIVAFAALLLILTACGKQPSATAHPNDTQSETVGVTTVERRPLASSITLSSELVPFQEIDVYAKEAGYIKNLFVDYGTHVRQGEVMAILEIPELQAQLDQDTAAIKAAQDRVSRAQHDVTTADAQHKVASLIYGRLANVANAKPGLVAQQEVDDAQGKNLASEGQLAAAQSALDGAQSDLAVARAKLMHDQALYSYSRITAPFEGVVTQRYANLGALMQAGTNSSTQAMPLVRLSQENLFRLVIPVPESDVRYVRIGDSVEVRVPALHHSVTGKVVRVSADVTEQTRTMHTEVDIQNVDKSLVPGLYAEAVLKLENKGDALAVPLQAIDREGARITVMVVGKDETLQQKEVTLGLQTANLAEVTSGLQEGDRIVVTERGGLRPGEKVRAQTINLLD
jgi:RND family efflux transporter MFP subunit